MSSRELDVVEYDLSGVVVNPNGTTFAVGDEVVGIIPADVNMKTASGAMCQWTVVKVRFLSALSSCIFLGEDRRQGGGGSCEDGRSGLFHHLRSEAQPRVLTPSSFRPASVEQEEHLVKKPSSLSFEDAAGLPLVGLTAYGGLLTEGNLQKGQKLFINGPSFTFSLAEDRCLTLD